MKNLLTISGVAAAVSLAGVHAANFTAGSLVIYRVGDGTSVPTDSAIDISLLEVSQSGALIQTISVPYTGSSRLTASITAPSEGKLRSHGEYLAITGYDAAVGTADVASGADPRRVLIYDSSGSLANSLTFVAGGPYAHSNIRGAIPTTTGNGAWTAGTNASGANGTYYIDGSGSAQIASGNFRSVEIFDHQLYGTTAAGSHSRAFTIGTGLPTSGPASLGNFNGLPATGSYYVSMQLFDLNTTVAGFDTIYLSNGTNIEKWSLVGGTWSFNNAVSAPSPIMDFTASFNGSSVHIFAVTASNLYGLSDSSGYNGNISGSFGSSLRSAGSSYFFRGIDFAPIPESATWALFGIGAAFLLWRKRRRAD